jgi:DNA helicase-2/ATP-dependent DNA helicase PcrA
VDSSVPPLSDLLDLYESDWIDDWYPDPETKADYKERGRRSLMDYHAAITKNPPRVFLLEQPFTLTIAGVKLKGRIDRIDDAGDTLEIIDYKTGTPKTKLDWEQKRQLILYKLAAEQCLPITKPIGALTYHYLEDNSTVSFTPKQSEIDKLVDQIGETVTAIAASTFEATPGMHCSFCDFKDICEFSQQ